MGYKVRYLSSYDKVIVVDFKCNCQYHLFVEIESFLIELDFGFFPLWKISLGKVSFRLS